jgi:TMEM175 potassium channel family protein
MKTARLLTLSDGIFAIALTLLVLALPIPKHSAHLAHDLVHQWPFYAAYAVSFVTIAIAWINHHALMDGVVRADRTLVELNLLLLLFVAAVPWPTGVVAQYLRNSHQAQAAALTYGLVMTLLAISFSAIWLRLAHAEDLAHPTLRPRIRQAIRRSMVGPTVYAAGTATSLISPPAALLLYAFVPLFFAVTRRQPDGPVSPERFVRDDAGAS